MDDRLQRIKEVVEEYCHTRFGSQWNGMGKIKAILEEPTPEGEKGGSSLGADYGFILEGCECPRAVFSMGKLIFGDLECPLHGDSKAPTPKECVCTEKSSRQSCSAKDCINEGGKNIPLPDDPKECECVCHEAYDGTDGYCKDCRCASAAEREKVPTSALKEPTEEKPLKIPESLRKCYEGKCDHHPNPPKEPEKHCMPDKRCWKNGWLCLAHKAYREAAGSLPDCPVPAGGGQWMCICPQHQGSDFPEVKAAVSRAYDRAQEKQPHPSPGDSECTCCPCGNGYRTYCNSWTKCPKHKPGHGRAR